MAVKSLAVYSSLVGSSVERAALGRPLLFVAAGLEVLGLELTEISEAFQKFRVGQAT